MWWAGCWANISNKCSTLRDFIRADFFFFHSYSQTQQIKTNNDVIMNGQDLVACSEVETMGLALSYLCKF